MKKGIIFDLDGTLWDTITAVVPIWNEVLKSHKEINKQITIEEMKGYMGKTIEDIAKLMFPNIKLEESLKILDECIEAEVVYLKEHGGTLYPRLEETLKNLKKSYKLFIVSNCQDGYIESFLEFYKLHDYFEDYECSGRTHKNKGENIKLIIERNKLDKSVYVGDTQTDLEATDLAKIPFIYAKYGFGTVDRDVQAIESIAELEEAVKSFN